MDGRRNMKLSKEKDVGRGAENLVRPKESVKSPPPHVHAFASEASTATFTASSSHTDGTAACCGPCRSRDRSATPRLATRAGNPRSVGAPDRPGRLPSVLHRRRFTFHRSDSTPSALGAVRAAFSLPSPAAAAPDRHWPPALRSLDGPGRFHGYGVEPGAHRLCAGRTARRVLLQALHEKVLERSP
jgi:hypothetical protein